MINHYGVAVDPGVPVTGVLTINGAALDTICFEIQSGIDVNYDTERENHERCCSNVHCIRDEHQAWEESYDSEEATLLIGAWHKDDQGKYEPDITNQQKDFAALVGNEYVQVVWSRFQVRVRSMCSPCYPGQANLDTDILEWVEQFDAADADSWFSVCHRDAENVAQLSSCVMHSSREEANKELAAEGKEG